MRVTNPAQTNGKARPILKWAGGKTQLLAEISQNLPPGMFKGEITRYVEAFTGGAAVFFHIAQTFPVEEYVLADINAELILLYKTVQTHADDLITMLAGMEQHYLAREENERKAYYYAVRENFNQNLGGMDFSQFSGSWVQRAAQIIFLNRTCYNGLFRVNAKGHFNVPFGRYKHPTICDAVNLQAAASLLQKALILSGDFTAIAPHVHAGTFVYFDPPYRPISKTASFNAYSTGVFGDFQQLRLRDFFQQLHASGAKVMLSNSDPKNINPDDHFFDEAYRGFHIKRVKAARMINSQAAKRGGINELLITNY